MDKTKMDNEEVELDWTDHEAKPGVSDGLRKLLASGLSTVMMSEEGVKQYLQDIKLPKETLSSLLSGVKKSKQELLNRVGDEFAQLIQKVDVVEELTKFLRENKIKCSMEIEFSKKDSDKKHDS